MNANSKTLDTLLVLPPMYQTGRIPDYNPKEPMGLMYLAAELRRQGTTVEILNADLSALTIEKTVGEIVARPAAVIGFSVLQRALPSLQLIVEELRRRGVTSHICCGGVGATLSAAHILECLPGVDSIVFGEGELALAKLVTKVKHSQDLRSIPGLLIRQGEILYKTGRQNKPEIDALPVPVRDSLSICTARTGYATIVGSRGCYAACTFCSNSEFERKSCGSGWRGRNPIAIVDEIEWLHHEYGVNAIKFNDPNLFGPGRRGEEHVNLLCQELIRRQLNKLHLMAFTRASDLTAGNCRLLRQAGFERLLIGIETFESEALHQLRKGETAEDIHRGLGHLVHANISIVPGFIIFNPYTTLASLERDLAWLDSYKFTVILSKAMRIFDGTALQAIMDQAGRLRQADPFEGYHQYTVDRDVATVYACLKEVAVKWLNVVTRHYQDRFWDIKKSPSFSDRSEFYSLQKILYAIESHLLRVLIGWVRDRNGSRRDVEQELNQIKRSLLDVELFLTGREPGQISGGVVSTLSVNELTDNLLHLLITRPHDTFPEKYRWAND
ncbi:cobalamin-dependent protein [Patescibacteria group bacterium]|nr:cobalamin-dependent protein [Patescibacteria group bacterium]MBU1029064.1 cobalamin-dependent protein [Patescibacteria group bacterium]